MSFFYFAPLKRAEEAGASRIRTPGPAPGSAPFALRHDRHPRASRNGRLSQSGTEGSNPASSSGESAANLTLKRLADAGRR
jgi:hypothetical protein